MNKKKYLILIVALISIMTTGCWNYNELNNLAIVTGMGIDKVDNEYQISLLIANTTETSETGGTQPKANVLSGNGKSITEATNKISSMSSKEIFSGHLNLLVISEEVAKEGIYNILDNFIRDPVATKSINLAVVRGSSSNEILKVLSPLEIIPSNNIVDNIETSSKYLGISYNTHLSDFLYNMINYGFDSVVPTIEIKGIKKEDSNFDELKETELNSEIILTDNAIFDNYKLVDYMGEDESKIINIISNKSISLNLYNKCYENLDKHIVLKIDNPKTKIELQINNDNIKYIFNIKASGSIEETNCKLHLNDTDVIEKITDYAKSDIRDMVITTMEKLKENKSDIFGLENILYKKNYKYWKKIRKKWDDIYKNLDYDINISLDLKTKGSLETTIKEVDK